MRTQGTAWHSGVNDAQALAYARTMYGPGYRVTAVRSRPDRAMGSGVQLLVRWEITDPERVRAEAERRHAPLTGLAAQAAAYLD